MYGSASQIKFKTSMLRSRLYGYSDDPDAYMLVKGTMIAPHTAVADVDQNKRNKQ